MVLAWMIGTYSSVSAMVFESSKAFGWAVCFYVEFTDQEKLCFEIG
jgi:hypothetical protein